MTWSFTFRHFSTDIRLNISKDGKFFYGFLFKYKIEGEPEWQQVVSTRLHHTLIFGEEEEGKYVLLQAA
jgi:hypothetical protein